MLNLHLISHCSYIWYLSNASWTCATPAWPSHGHQNIINISAARTCSLFYLFY